MKHSIKFFIFSVSLLINLISSLRVRYGLSSRDTDRRILNQDEKLTSKNGKYYVNMQSDGNFVLYSKGGMNGKTSDNAIWSSGTNGKGTSPYKIQMQEDGNLVLYDSKNNAQWSSNTNGKGTAPFKVIVQDDGNFVLYDSKNTAIWNSNTQGKQ
jgi:hypothetical protein